MLKEFQDFPNVISGASDFTAVFYIESLLKVLNDFDCVDLPKFCGAPSRFSNAASTSTIRADEDVRALKIKFAKEFWVATGKDFMRKLAREKHEEVSACRLC
jgi:hypothetical protein